MAAESNENATAELDRNDAGIPIADVSLWQIQQQYQQMVKQIQLQREMHTMYKKQCMLLKAKLLQKQLQLQKCARLQWLLKCCGDRADDRCQYRVKKGSKLADDPVANEFAIVEPASKDLPAPLRSWTNQQWRWCAAGYGGCCRHCPEVDASPIDFEQQKQQLQKWLQERKPQQEHQGDQQIEQDQESQEQELQAQEPQAPEPQQTQEQEQEQGEHQHQQPPHEQEQGEHQQQEQQGLEREPEWGQEQEQEWEQGQEQEQEQQPYKYYGDGSSTGQLAVWNTACNMDLHALQWNDIDFFLQTSFY